jgi:hypothetical protein
MLTRIDHIAICVPDLAHGVAAYTRMGFNIYDGGVPATEGTHHAIAVHDEDDALQLLSVRDPASYRDAAPIPGCPEAGLLEFLEQGGGFRYVAIQSDDLVGDVAAMRRRKVDVTDVVESAHRAPTGQVLRWNVATLGPGNPLPIFFVQHLTPGETRAQQVPTVNDHPNRVQRTDRVYIAVEDVAREAQVYSRVLGIPVPRVQRGNVIKADMAVFDLGPTGLTIAQPAEPGPAAEALGRRGPGPFQVLYRTASMDAAARWMVEHGMPPPAVGVRNTGEKAMLVGPTEACGAYIGFVGPA